jgi:hypothetical protein
MKRWSLGAKIVAVSAIGVSLGFSLCGGPKVFVVGYDSSLQRVASVVFVLSSIMLVIGVVIWIVNGISGDGQ